MRKLFSFNSKDKTILVEEVPDNKFQVSIWNSKDSEPSLVIKKTDLGEAMEVVSESLETTIVVG